VELHERFEAVARAHAAKTAIVHEANEISYATLLQRSLILAGFLSKGLERDAVIGLFVHAPPAFVAAYLGAAGARARVVLLDPRTAKEAAQSVRHFQISHLLCTERELPELAAYLTSTRTAEVDGTRFILGAVRADLRADTSNYRAGDFVVHCTSGSTGTPKGIVLSADNIVHRILNWSETLALTPDDTVLCSLTLSHCHGIDVLMLPGLFNGCRVVAPDLDRISPRRVAKLFVEQGVTVFSTLPYFYELMLDTVSPERVDLTRLRYMISGSAPLSDRTARLFRDRFGRGIQQVYGLSEIGVICLNKDPDKVGSIGELITGVAGRIADEGAADGSGELVVSGKALARGYLSSPDAERTFFRGGELWTQDLVTHDASGFVIVGRRSRFINSGGNKVDPVELEDLLKTHPQVLEAVVTAAPDALRGEQIVAYLRTRTAVAIEELHTFMRQRAALYKLPAEYRFVDSIPKNGLGKVQVSALGQRA
jgi:acyl-CoA synthetase (AMP-forming)/AMP-acid ligase II